jgi:CheY-like chemotaxis protein
MILVLDDAWLDRKAVLTDLIGTRAEVRGIRNFTVEGLRRGDAAAGIGLDMIAASRPEVIIADLAIISREGGNPMRGIDLLAKIRAHSILGATPLIVVSDHTQDRRVSAHLRRLNVLGAFDWRDLKGGNTTERAKFSVVIDDALKIASESHEHE